jgi:glycosyltransferase involved in cell wall biosynthesis
MSSGQAHNRAPFAIGIDARQLELERAGVARYLLNLLRVWATAAQAERFLLYLSRSGLPEGWLQQPPFQPRRLGPPRQQQTVWEHLRLPQALGQDRADVLLAPYYMAPLFCPVPYAVVLHDIAFSAHPEYFRKSPLYFKLRLVGYWSARRARAIVTVSEFSKREIVRRYRLNPERIHVIPEAADPSFAPLAEPERAAETTVLRRKFDLPERFVLAVGSLTPRRHLRELLQALALVRRDHPELGLMVVGRDLEYRHGQVARMVEAAGLGSVLRRVDYVDEADLAGLYRGAAVAVYLSSYEGFGLPILEAMASGAPVVAGDRASLPEVAGAAAVLVDPSAPREIAAALAAIVADPSRAAELRRRGLERAREFSWQRSARQTLELLRAIA